MMDEISERVHFVGKFFSNPRGGLGRYESEIISRLEPSENFSYEQAKPVRTPDWLSNFANVFGVDLKAVFNNHPIRIKSAPRDGIVHFANPSLSPGILHSDSLSVVTVHDIYPYLQYRQKKADVSLSRKYIEYAQVLLSRRADHLITVSYSTKRDLENYLDIPPEKISVTHLGVDTSHFHPTNPDTCFKSTCISNDKATLLYVGSLSKRKDPATLFAAFSEVLRTIDAELILVGSGRAPDGKHDHLLKELGIEDNVKFLDYVPDDKLVYLYGAADIFVMPSKYEGFGLPVLEAMACGTPVIASNVGSLPEVVDNAGVLVRPESPESFAGKIIHLLDDSEYYNTLSERGLYRASKFTWEQTVEKTINVYSGLSKN